MIAYVLASPTKSGKIELAKVYSERFYLIREEAEKAAASLRATFESKGLATRVLVYEATIEIKERP